MTWLDELIPDATIPEGVSGDWEVERFTVGEQAASAFNIKAAGSGHSRGILPGIYTRLACKGRIIMSDTPQEKLDHVLPVQMAYGHMLVTGLGLGIVIRAMLLKPKVKSVTVVENSADVLSLVLPTLKAEFGDRLAVVEADALEWKLPTEVGWHGAWHDIWPSLSVTNLPQMTKLKRKFCRRVVWQHCWGEDIIRRQLHAEKREYHRLRVEGL